MKYANNSEMMAFDKSGWAKIETTADGTIYMGKPFNDQAADDAPVWSVRRISKYINESGNEEICTMIGHYVDDNGIDHGTNKCRWSLRTTLTYKYH